MTRTSQLDFGEGPCADPAYQGDAKHEQFTLAEVCALPSAVLVYPDFGSPFSKSSGG